jgi:hypothetical protein
VCTAAGGGLRPLLRQPWRNCDISRAGWAAGRHPQALQQQRRQAEVEEVCDYCGGACVSVCLCVFVAASLSRMCRFAPFALPGVGFSAVPRRLRRPPACAPRRCSSVAISQVSCAAAASAACVATRICGTVGEAVFARRCLLQLRPATATAASPPLRTHCCAVLHQWCVRWLLCWRRGALSRERQFVVATLCVCAAVSWRWRARPAAATHTSPHTIALHTCCLCGGGCCASRWRV